MIKNIYKTVVLGLFFFAFLLFSTFLTNCLASDEIKLSNGQTVYVSIYSNVFSGWGTKPFIYSNVRKRGKKPFEYQLAAMLSIRNTDIHNSIRIISADYFDNDGKLLKKYIDRPLVLIPLGSNYIYIERDDKTGGFGANFIVQWESTKEVNVPIIEGIMIGFSSHGGVSLLGPGQVIKENTK